MIYLNLGLFKPMIITLSIFFLPIITLSLIWTISDFQFKALITFIILLLLYMLVSFLGYMISKSKKHFFEVRENQLHIKYPNVKYDGTDELYIEKNKVCRFKYYKMSSVWSWLSWLFGVFYIFPQSVYIEYKSPVGVIEKHIGYMTGSQIQQLITQTKIELVIYKALFSKVIYK